jgi:O-phosphoseryl-tRNA(Cys) synthetase
MRQSARRLVKHVQKQGNLKQDKVVKAVEAVMDKEAKEAVEVADNMLLGMKELQTAPTPLQMAPTPV